jgi:hypothetical protein
MSCPVAYGVAVAARKGFIALPLIMAAGSRVLFFPPAATMLRERLGSFSGGLLLTRWFPAKSP